MANVALRTALGINQHTKTLTFYSLQGTDYHNINIEDYPFKNNFGTDHFVDELNDAMKKYAAKRPAAAAVVLNVVLPDYSIALDNISIPSINKKAMDNSLKIAMEGLYKNYKELKVKTGLVAKNKQYSTFSIAMMPQTLNASISAACSLNKFVPGAITFAGNAAVAGVAVTRKKMINASYVFIDVKPRYSRMCYVIKGKVFGVYDLPFGYTILRNNRLTAEDLIVTHDVAELAVINAKEKARAKQLTVMDDSSSSDSESGGDSNSNSNTTVTAPPAADDGQKVFSKKSARKLPKFMLRDLPDTEEGYVYENFRIFVKWALTFIRGNETLEKLGKPESVLVNIPSEFNYVFDMVNAEKEENGVEFTAYDPAADRFSSVTENLELFGGLFLDQFPSINNL